MWSGLFVLLVTSLDLLDSDLVALFLSSPSPSA